MMQNMKQNSFTAVYKKSGKWYSGWIEEIPGVNSQGQSLKETRENLKDALLMIIEANKLLHKSRSVGRVTRESFVLAL